MTPRARDPMAQAHSRVFEPGEVVTTSPGSTSGLCRLDAGCLGVQRWDDDGYETMVRVVLPGQLFGYEELLGRDGPPMRVLTLTRSCVLVLCRTVAQRRLSHDRGFAHMLVKQLADDVVRAETRQHAAAWHSVSTRVAALFRELASHLGRPAPDGRTALTLPMRRQDLAAAVGARPETLARALRSLQADGWLDLSGRHVVLTDPDSEPETR